MLTAEGLMVAGMKPVASGCSAVNGAWRNADALAIQGVSPVSLPYEWINPYAFKDFLSPHLASRSEHCHVSLDRILETYRRVRERADVIVAEGAGGWLSPLSDTLDVADLASALGLEVIMVVGVRLGCINHARLTERQIRNSAVPYAGWVANCVDPHFSATEETIHSLENYLGSKPLCRIEFEPYDEGERTTSNNHWNRSEILRHVLPSARMRSCVDSADCGPRAI
jgi:dethiobiotin synthetase